MAEPPRQRRSGWVLLVVLLIPYLFIKFQAWGCINQVKQLDQELNRLRPGLSAIVLSEQLTRTKQVCEQITVQVRGLGLKNGLLLEQLSHLPPSITLNRLENRSRLKVPLHQLFSGEASGASLQTDLRMDGTLLPGIRDPESVLVRWAESLQNSGLEVSIRRLAPSPGNPHEWLFQLTLKAA